MIKYLLAFASFLVLAPTINAQNTEAIVAEIQKEATENSQLENMAHELMDVIGPRLVGTPQMKKAHDWAVESFFAVGHPGRERAMGNLERLGTRYLSYRSASSPGSIPPRASTGLEPIHIFKGHYRRSDSATCSIRFPRLCSLVAGSERKMGLCFHAPDHWTTRL